MLKRAAAVSENSAAATAEEQSALVQAIAHEARNYQNKRKP